VLAEGIAVAAAGRKRYRGQQLYALHGDALAATHAAVAYRLVSRLQHRDHIVPVIEDHVDRIGQVGVDPVCVIK